VKALASAGAAGFAVMAVAAPALATETGNYIDSAGNLANTEQTLHCTAKIEAGFHPPAVLNNGFTIETFGFGNCNSGTTFDHGIVDIQRLDHQGNWNTVASTTFTTAAQFFGVADNQGPGNGGACQVLRARTRVWRRADATHADPTIAVKSNSVTVGSQNLFEGACKV
jgi:hypothetical protein